LRGYTGKLAAAVGAAAAALIAGTAGADASTMPAQPNIVGGTPLTQHVPGGAKVTLKYDAPGGVHVEHECGAVLVFGRYIVTQAHCVTDFPSGLTAPEKTKLAQWFGLDKASASIPVADKKFWVRIGSNRLNSGGETARVTEWIVHPGWTWGMTSPTDDIAMGLLDHTAGAQTVKLANGPAAPGTLTYTLGWGRTTPDNTGDANRTIQELAARVIDPGTCAKGGMTGGEVCIENPNGTDGPCGGDSGGPALALIDGAWQLEATVSRAIEPPYCGAVPTIYTSSPEFRGWIYAVGRGERPAPAPTASSVPAIPTQRTSSPVITRPTVQPQAAAHR
jgi:secreted trypsin-like serine protease